MKGHDTRAWRVGTHYKIHLYAVNPDGDDEPIATASTPEVAAQIVAEHNLCLTPYADDEHQGGSWVETLSWFTGRQVAMQREINDLRAARDRFKAMYLRNQGIVDGRFVWRARTACPGEVTVVHDSTGQVWRRQDDRQWLSDAAGTTPGGWSDLVRVFGPITEGLPPAPT